MTCDELESRLAASAAFLDDAAPDEDLRAHLDACPDCRARSERLEAATRRLGDLVRERAAPLSAGLRDRVLAAAMPAAQPSSAPRARFHPGLLAAALVAAGTGFVLFHAPVSPATAPVPLREVPRPPERVVDTDADGREHATVDPVHVAAVASAATPANDATVAATSSAAASSPPPLASKGVALDNSSAGIDSETLATLAELKVLVASNALTPNEERELARDLVSVATLGSLTDTRAEMMRAVNSRVAVARKRSIENLERESEEILRARMNAK